jgi:hypothetical protein
MCVSPSGRAHTLRRVIPEEDEARRKRTPQEERDTLAERRARRAWLGDAALLRRAEAAEASVGTLEAHLDDLRGRQAESEREREHTAAQLAERELELRRVKQREYAEQQLRVEAEEVAVRARRGQRAELDRWQRRVEAAQADAQRAEEQRDALAARLAAVNESCERLRAGVLALQGVATELRTTFEREHLSARARIRELEGALERARAHPPEQQRSEADEAQRREEMAVALAAAVARLRTRVALVPELEGGAQPSAVPPPSAVPQPITAPERPPAATPQSPQSLQSSESPELLQSSESPESLQSSESPELLQSSESPELLQSSESPELLQSSESPESLQSSESPELLQSSESPELLQSSESPESLQSSETSQTDRTASAQAGDTEVPTVIVVPRLFTERGRSARRLAPAVRRVAVRLAKWADRAQERKR